MDQRFLSLLPAPLQEVVADAEKLGGSPIVVRPDETGNDLDSVAVHPRDATGVARAVIYYRGDSITRCALVHEVLHIKRYWLENVVSLRWPVRSRFEFEAGVLEEMLEHLVIIPEERKFVAAESDAHWSAVLAGKIREIPSPPASARRVTLQLHVYRAMLDIALPHLENGLLYSRLDEAGQLAASDHFVRALRPLVPDKLKALSFVVETFFRPDDEHRFIARPMDL